MDKINKRQNAARGLIPADLVLKNGIVLDVFTHEMIPADVAVVGGVIVGVGKYSGVEEIDCTGKIISPGFIDAHLHIESTMVSPLELAKIVVLKGTTTMITDPHELVNVKGSKGLDYLLEAANNTPVNIFTMLPSAVPATPFDTNGAGEFLARDMLPYVDHPRVLGLGEAMSFLDVMYPKPEMTEKLRLFSGRVKDGHAPGLRGKEIQSYKLAGIANDHECSTFKEAFDKMRAGFDILIREGSAARNLEAILSGMLEKHLPFERCAFCTDDKHLEDIVTEGHIDHCVRKAIALGVPPIYAYKMATYYPSKMYGLRKSGAVAAGYKADLLILDDLEKVSIREVIKGGKRVDQEYLESFRECMPAPEMLHTVVFHSVKEEDLALRVKETNHVIGLLKDQIVTEHLCESLPQQDGLFIPDEVYSKLCVVERHGRNGNLAVAAIKGFGIRNGAIATSVSHDSHNIIAVGDNDRDLVCAINSIKEMQGGYVLASQGRVLDALPLRIGGLISMENGSYVRKKTAQMLKEARTLGIPEGVDPFITLSFMALPVIPHLRLLDTGLFDVDCYQLLDKCTENKIDE